MTIPELIATVLANIRNHWYADRVREFKRDERALIKAISRYGYECNQRGWEFDETFIHREITTLLRQIRTSDADVEYLPVYLDGAIRRSIGQRAEELSAEAKSISIRAAKIVNGLQGVEAVREPSAVEVFANVFKGVRKINKSRKPKSPVKEKQQSLL